jgi:hypothetical protein
MTINDKTDALTGIIFSCIGGKFHVKLDDPEAKPGFRFGQVVDDNGNQIGRASDYLYSGRGFAINTAPYAGFVPLDQVQFV